MTIYIWGRYCPSDTVEKLDQASNKKEAGYLVGEYTMAFGKNWKIWAGRKKDEPEDEVREGNYRRYV